MRRPTWPPHTPGILVRLPLVGDADIGLRAVADVPVEPRLEVRAVRRLQRAIDVVVQVVRIAVVRQRIQAGEILAGRRHVRPHVVVRRRLARARESERDLQHGWAVQVRAAVGEQLAEVPSRIAAANTCVLNLDPGVDLLPLSFERREEEQLVPVLRVAVAEGNRAADVAARILVLALRLRGAGDAVGSVVGGELAGAHVIVRLAVELRGARLGDAADVHPARAVLGGEVGALHLHFLNHVVVQGDDDAAVAPDVDERRAVQRDGVARGADAVDRVALGVVAAAAEADRLALVEVGDDARQDAEQLERAAADDRQVVDLLGAQHAFARAGLGLDDFLLRGDGNRLGLLADVEAHVDAAVVARAEGERLALVGLEA